VPTDTPELFQTYANNLGLTPKTPSVVRHRATRRVANFSDPGPGAERPKPIPAEERLNPLDLYENDLRLVLLDRQGRIRGRFPVFHPDPAIGEAAASDLQRAVQAASRPTRLLIPTQTNSPPTAMKRLIPALLSLCALLVAQPSAHADNKSTTYRYEGEIAGVMCNACSSTVKHALMKLPGVKQVKITFRRERWQSAAHRADQHPSLTRAAAVQALGSAASHFDIRALDLVTNR